MAKYYYEHNGELQEVELASKALSTFKASNPHLTVLRASEVDVDMVASVAQRNAVARVRDKRTAEYPVVEDVMDELMKWIFTETEITFTPALYSLAAKYMNVKSQHPLP